MSNKITVVKFITKETLFMNCMELDVATKVESEHWYVSSLMLHLKKVEGFTEDGGRMFQVNTDPILQ